MGEKENPWESHCFHTEPDTAINKEGTYHCQTVLLTFWGSGHLPSGGNSWDALALFCADLNSH